jgi:hypothetical protein
MGENEMTRVSFICRKENSASDWDPVPGHDLGHGPVVVAGDQDVLAEEFFFERGPGVRVDAPGQAQVPGLVAVECPGDDTADPWLGGDRLDLGGDLVLAAAGLAAGQGGGQFVQLLASSGQRGAVESACLAVAQFRGVGEDGAPPGAVDLASGVVSGQAAEPVLIDHGSLAGRQGGQVRAVRGGHGPYVVQPAAGQVREVGLAVLPGIEDHGHVRRRSRHPGRIADRLVTAAQLSDHGGELGDIGLIAGVGMPGQRGPAVPGDDQAQPH